MHIANMDQGHFSNLKEKNSYPEFELFFSFQILLKDFTFCKNMFTKSKKRKNLRKG